VVEGQEKREVLFCGQFNTTGNEARNDPAHGADLGQVHGGGAVVGVGAKRKLVGSFRCSRVRAKNIEKRGKGRLS